MEVTLPGIPEDLCSFRTPNSPFFQVKILQFHGGGAGVVYTNSETNSKFAPKKWMLGNTFSFPFGAFIGPIFRGKLAEFQGV